MKTIRYRAKLQKLTYAICILGLVSMSNPAKALNCNVGIDFHPQGTIKSCVLNGNHQLWTKQNEPVGCIDGKTITQYANGGLKSCVIAELHAFGDKRCEGPARVEFARDGRLLHCEKN